MALGCSENSQQKTESSQSQLNQTYLYQFDLATELNDFLEENTQLSLIPETAAIENATSKRLSVTFLAKENYKSSLTIQPKKPWNWQQDKAFYLALDIENPTQDSTHIFGQVIDNKKQTHTRSVVIPKQSKHTFYIELKGEDLNQETGIRSNPASWQSKDKPFIWRWGVKNLDLTQIVKVKFSVTSLLKDKTIILDNIRLVDSPEMDPNYLADLVDKYGQSTRVDYPQKVETDDVLQKVSQAELEQLDGKLMPDRSKFGGWKFGPKLEATGYFRAEKLGNTWTMVDPEGYLFYSHGIANVRMANTTTITGRDYKKPIPQTAASDVTPEDSKGVIRASDDVLKTVYVASELRHKMFQWLPEYDDSLAKHFGYRRSVHTGALEKGETFSFYQANLERKYGDDFIPKWRDVTVDRMINWGFTSFGNWIDPMFYQLDRFPYFANGWIIGDFKKVSSGADYWSPLPDPFDPEFSKRAKATVDVIAKEVQQNPWCVGIFIDNEKSWGSTSSLQAQYGIVIHTLNRTATESPTKAEFVKLMQTKYQTIEQLNQSWNTKISSWNSFATGFKTQDLESSANMIADYSAMLSHYAQAYFDVVNKALKQQLPNHMYMGARFADWGMTAEVVEAAAKYADVVSYNFYKEGLQDKHWAFLEQIDKPSIIGEFHMGATDTGLLNPGLVHAQSQQDRADMYTEYMQSVLKNNYFVGAHWFQYTDSPLTGRAYDGENYNVGYVSVTDTPYKEMVEATKKITRDLYSNKYGHLK
ncbi:agarase [Catenovulum maritimum]|nr:agarase Q6 [Catenovulum maritimum]KMT67009.1 agarase [Catenovulum maritimum]